MMEQHRIEAPAAPVSSHFRQLVLPLFAATLLACVPAQASEKESAGPEPATGEPATTVEANDKCEPIPGEKTLPEKAQSGVFEFSCRTVRWFDGLFGQSLDFQEESVNGRVTLGAAWNEYENLDPSFRLKLRTDLPNMSKRWRAFIGRVDEDDYVSDYESTQASGLRRGISGNDDPEWLLGLGYRDYKRGAAGWDYSLGIRLNTPPRVYARARYQKVFQLSEIHDLRFRQTFFWRDGTGFGTTSTFDSARELNPSNVLRWELIGKLSEKTEGVEWWAAHTWYHRLNDKRGISLRAFARGLSDAAVPLQEYGLELTWRRQLSRDWLFLNAGPTLTWPRERLDEKREASLGIAVLLEMEFGYRED